MPKRKSEPEIKRGYALALEFGYDQDELTWNHERHRAQTDLFWLAKDLLGYDLVDTFICWTHPKYTFAIEGPCPECGQSMDWYSGVPNELSLHREMCNGFVHKNPDIDIPNQDSTKNRLFMLPRGSFKSSIDQADAVQWIITFPQVRIAILTAKEDLGLAFVSAVRNFFIIKEDDFGNVEANRFQRLFPEHCITSKKKEAEEEFTTPARDPNKFFKEPSVLALSMGATKSGWHFDVGKYDDCVSDKNSGPTATSEQRKAVGDAISLARALIEPYGYHDTLGTPYDEDDAYAKQLERPGLRIIKRGAWKRRKNVPVKKKEEELTASDVILLFPVDSKGYPRLPFNVLRNILLDDPHVFATQYLCQPSSTRVVRITEQLVKSRITQDAGLPQHYRCFAAWDFAYSVESGRDFSVGVVGWLDEIKLQMFIMDIVRGRFNKSDLAFQVARLATRWKVERIRVENSSGADFLETDIRRQLILLSNEECPIEWFPVDSQKNAKNSRAEGIETLLLESRLWFSASISNMSDVIHELVNFRPHSKRKDDMVDAIAHVCALMPTIAETPLAEKERQEKFLDVLVQKQLHEMIYPGYVPPPEPPAALPIEFDGTPIACSGCGAPPSYCICR